MILSGEQCLVYPEIVNTKHPLYSIKTKNEESREATVTAFLVLRKVLSNYISHYEKLKAQVEHAEDTLDIEEIESVGKKLKKFWDVVRDFERLLIELEEKSSGRRFIDTEIIGYDYDVLLAKAAHLSDRVRGAMKEIDNARNKCEVNYSKQLNANIERLTKIMAYITMVQVLIAMPMLIASFYGMNIVFPDALRETPEYPMLASPTIAFGIIVAVTLISIALAYRYLKKWGIF
jgi:Mg2+ and Co2+ transporter CorA